MPKGDRRDWLIDNMAKVVSPKQHLSSQERLEYVEPSKENGRKYLTGEGRKPGFVVGIP